MGNLPSQGGPMSLGVPENTLKIKPRVGDYEVVVFHEISSASDRDHLLISPSELRS